MLKKKLQKMSYYARIYEVIKPKKQVNMKMWIMEASEPQMVKMGLDL